MIRRPAWLELSDQGGGEGRWGWTGRHLNCTQMFGRPQGKLTGRWGFKAGTWSDVIRSSVKVERSVGYHLTCPPVEVLPQRRLTLDFPWMLGSLHSLVPAGSALVTASRSWSGSSDAGECQWSCFSLWTSSWIPTYISHLIALGGQILALKLLLDVINVVHESILYIIGLYTP